jgi:hypothetical protein
MSSVLIRRVTILSLIVIVTAVAYVQIQDAIHKETNSTKIMKVPQLFMGVSPTTMCSIPQQFTESGKVLSFEGDRLSGDDKVYCNQCNRIYHKDPNEPKCKRFYFTAQDNHNINENDFMCSEDVGAKYTCPIEKRSIL